MDLQLKGKTPIVTGGSAGIGLTIARMLAEEGVEVIIPGRKGKKLAEAIKSTRVTVNSVLAGPTRSEAIVGFLQGVASTPDATPEQAEKEFFERHRPTPLIQRMAEESEVASLVAYLASPLAAATNGAAMRVEGGILRTIF